MVDHVAFEDAERARTEDLPFLRRQVERSAIALEIGQAMGLSECQVQNRLASGRRVREAAPITWYAFKDGRIDSARIREISSTIDQLQRPESIARLDAHVVKYAATHTVAELRRWLKDFVNRVEIDLALERAERDRADRHVSVTHVENSMSWINAFVPTHQAAAIEKRRDPSSGPWAGGARQPGTASASASCEGARGTSAARVTSRSRSRPT